MSNALAIVTGVIAEARDDFSRVLVDRTISFEREAGFAIQILQNNDFSMKIAMGNKQSLMAAVKNIAAIGISLNPARKQAYLVPRGGAICLDISYIGLIDIAISSGSILWAQAELVREGDAFTLNGYDRPPTHEFNPFGKDRGAIIGTYVVAKMHSGDYLTTTMSIDDVHSIRNRSESYKKGNGPWKTDEGEMIKKTVIKRAYKLWPKTERLDQVMNHLNVENGEGLAAPEKPQDWVDVAPMIAEVMRTTSPADAKAYWAANNHKLAKQPQDHARLKQAMIDHGLALKKKQAEDANTVEMPTSSQAPAATVDDEFVRQMDAHADDYVPE